MAEGFDPNRSTVGNDRMSAWISQPITGDLSEVPGLGPAGIAKLKDKGVTTTFNLIGEYLLLKGEGVESVEHCDKFWYWLQDTGISSHRAGIVLAIAEKMDMMFPGIYDKAPYN